MAWSTPRTWVDGEKVRASYFLDVLDQLRYLKGQDGPVSFEVRTGNHDIIVTEATEHFLLSLRDSTGGGFLKLLAHDDDAAVHQNNAGVVIKFIFREQGGAEDEVAKIEFTHWTSGFDSGYPPGCIIRFWVKSGGSYPGTPNFTLTGDGNCGVNNGVPSYALDVTGDIDMTSLAGLAGVWRDLSGTITYVGNATATGALISQVATGTAPLEITNPFSDLNLNASYVHGATWGGAVLTGGGTASLTPLSGGWKTVASCAVSVTGCYLVTGSYYLSTLDGYDYDAAFLATVTGNSYPSEMLPAGLLGGSDLTTLSVSSTGIANLTSGQSAYLYAMKNGGGGTTVASGAVKAVYLGPTL